MRTPRNSLDAAGLNYACEKLKEYVRASHAKRTAESNPLGDQILWAVEKLPDARTAGNWVEFDLLPLWVRESLEAFIVQTEIKYHADFVCEEIEERFPELRKATTDV